MGTNTDIVEKLILHELLTPLARAEAEIEYINNFPLKGTSWITAYEEQKIALMKELGLKNDSELDEWRNKHKLTEERRFTKYTEFRTKRRIVLDEILKNTGESLFLRYKDRLDRVLYSLIRIESDDLAYKLYYEIESNEIEFGEASASHSCGPESKTQGIIGPVDLTTPHPEIAARLRTAQSRQLFPPFKADDWWTIIRLEYRFDSEYNEKTKHFLGGLLLGSKITNMTQAITDNYWQTDESIR
mgnify:CR=1 FL=1